MKIESLEQQVAAELMALPDQRRAAAILFIAAQTTCARFGAFNHGVMKEATHSLVTAINLALEAMGVQREEVDAGCAFAVTSLRRAADMAAEQARSTLN